MGKHHWLKIECLHMVGDPESKRLKVAALNLSDPITSPLLRQTVFSYCDPVSEGGGLACLPVGRGEGDVNLFNAFILNIPKGILAGFDGLVQILLAMG
jgi:hypothetical protein